MNRTLFSTLAAAALAASLLAPARAHTSYTVSVTDLTPAHDRNADASGISDDTQVGQINFSATLWTGTAASAVNLGPAGYDFSLANGVDGDTQVGVGQASFGGVRTTHALLWHGTAASLVDINPPGYFYSEALGIFGNTEVGDGIVSGDTNLHALLWTSMPDSAVDLHPAGYEDSSARADSGNAQVGYASKRVRLGGSYATVPHAVLWHGSADSVVDLQPQGYISSIAYGVDGDTQVGNGQTNSVGRALLWHGTADSAQDLTPSGFYQGYALAISGGAQVGKAEATTTNGECALLWTGTAQSAINLNHFLPAGFRGGSEAHSVEVNGNVVSVVGMSNADDGRSNHAFLWQVTFPAQPTLLQLDPATRTAGRGAFTLIVHGTGFKSNSVVKWNGAAQPTTLVSPFEVDASIPASLTASTGTASVAVTTPGYAVTLSRTVTVHS